MSQWWLDQHAGAFQAVAALFGLLGLIWYCVLTLGIRRESQKQTLASLRPFIIVDDLRQSDDLSYKVNQRASVLRNLGNGPALKVRWRPGHHNLDWRVVGDLAKGDWSDIHTATKWRMFYNDWPDSGIDIRYEDFSANSYETSVRVIDGMARQEFRQVAKKK